MIPDSGPCDGVLDRPRPMDHGWKLGKSLRQAALHQAPPRPDRLPAGEYVAGIENPTEAFPNIVRWLVKHGYSDDDIAKVIGGNAMRVLDKVWWR